RRGAREADRGTGGVVAAGVVRDRAELRATVGRGVQLRHVRRTLGTVVTAAYTQPVERFPAAQDLVGIHFLTRAVLRVAGTEFQFHAADERQVTQHRDQQLAVGFLHGHALVDAARTESTGGEVRQVGAVQQGIRREL